MRDILTFLPFLALVFAAASTGRIFEPGDWYKGLAKPRWNPPDWLFPVAWLILYLMIAVAGWRVWERTEGAVLVLAMTAYIGQIILNGAWSAIFFGLKRIRLALAELGALWLAIAVTIALFYPIDPVAAWLLAPYLAWVSFAGVLNGAIVRLNPAA
ncbi:MAG: TspO/MBR family protein [Alphaproteobacteria bacterium]|nr:TspO/MBR family protein [Alphaproteobacteria bacterium]